LAGSNKLPAAAPAAPLPPSRSHVFPPAMNHRKNVPQSVDLTDVQRTRAAHGEERAQPPVAAGRGAQARTPDLGPEEHPGGLKSGSSRRNWLDEAGREAGMMIAPVRPCVGWRNGHGAKKRDDPERTHGDPADSRATCRLHDGTIISNLLRPSISRNSTVRTAMDTTLPKPSFRDRRRLRNRDMQCL